ncbi:hypothetical protein NL676_023482 [Syzygium grande]|nr:hypothetical protein NL676_023482 [Syzygium grande]
MSSARLSATAEAEVRLDPANGFFIGQIESATAGGGFVRGPGPSPTLGGAGAADRAVSGSGEVGGRRQGLTGLVGVAAFARGVQQRRRWGGFDGGAAEAKAARRRREQLPKDEVEPTVVKGQGFRDAAKQRHHWRMNWVAVEEADFLSLLKDPPFPVFTRYPRLEAVVTGAVVHEQIGPVNPKSLETFYEGGSLVVGLQTTNLLELSTDKHTKPWQDPTSLSQLEASALMKLYRRAIVIAAIEHFVVYATVEVEFRLDSANGLFIGQVLRERSVSFALRSFRLSQDAYPAQNKTRVDQIFHHVWKQEISQGRPSPSSQILGSLNAIEEVGGRRQRRRGEVIGVDRDVGNLDVHNPEKKTVKSFSTLIGNDRRWYRFPVHVETLVSPHLNNVAA